VKKIKFRHWTYTNLGIIILGLIVAIYDYVSVALGWNTFDAYQAGYIMGIETIGIIGMFVAILMYELEKLGWYPYAKR